MKRVFLDEGEVAELINRSGGRPVPIEFGGNWAALDADSAAATWAIGQVADMRGMTSRQLKKTAVRPD